jgi:DNA polymerase-3 subunit beta
MFIKETSREVLLKPLQVIIGIVERKQPLPILSNVLIEKNARKIRFVTRDLEVQIETEIPTDYENIPGSLTVSAKKLFEILRVLSEGSKVNLDVQDSRLIIKANKSRFNLQTLPAKDYPIILNQLDNCITIELPQLLLKNILSAVQYAMAQQDIRYYLNGVLLVIEGKNIRAIATDGHRLAYSNGIIELEYPKHEVIISRKTVNELLKLLNNNQEDVEIKIAEKQIRFTFSDTTLTAKTIDGKFPDYERVIPKYSNHLTINKFEVLQALQRASILSNEKFKGVRLVLTEKNLKIISTNSEQEEAQEEIESDYHGEALDIGFNVNYLLDGLNYISNEMVTLSFGDPNSSILISIPLNDNFKYVVMPMRI